MAMRDEIAGLLAHGCPSEEIVSSLGLTYHPDSIRKALKASGIVARVPQPKKQRVRRPPVGMGKADAENVETDRRIDLFFLAPGKTREEIRRARPAIPADWIDRELASMCLPFMAPTGGKLPAVLCLEGGVYRKRESSHATTDRGGSPVGHKGPRLGRAAKSAENGQRRKK